MSAYNTLHNFKTLQRMILKNLMLPYDFKNLHHNYAALFTEVLKKHKETMAGFFALQNAEVDDKVCQSFISYV